jgi:hypothetical protein
MSSCAIITSPHFTSGENKDIDGLEIVQGCTTKK